MQKLLKEESVPAMVKNWCKMSKQATKQVAATVVGIGFIGEVWFSTLTGVARGWAEQSRNVLSEDTAIFSPERKEGIPGLLPKEAKKKEEVSGRIKELIITAMNRLNLKEDQIVPEAFFVRDLGADSLDIVELIITIEKEFDIEIPDEDLEIFTSV